MYEIDLDAGELRKNGLKIRLQEQPFKVLARLLNSPGELVTREELQEQLWGAHTQIDPELGLNTAVKKLRTALGDSADNPRFIETVPKRGYRFIAPGSEIGQTYGLGVSAAQPERLPPASQNGMAAASNQCLDGQTGGQVGGTVKRYVSKVAKPHIYFVTLLTTAWGAYRPRKGAYYGLAVLILAVAGAGVLAGQIERASLHIFGQPAGRKGIAVYTQGRRPDGSDNGIGGYNLGSRSDLAFAFDYDQSGKLDHLVLYRPGAGYFWILKNSSGTFRPVYTGNGIGGYDLMSGADRIIAFDFEHSGKLDHLALYRPGTGLIAILKNEGDGVFTPVYERSQNNRGVAISHFPADQAFAFDYDGSGMLDHLVLYQRVTGTIEILTNSNGTFGSVCAHGATAERACPYDLKRPAGQALAFDYDHSGKLDHLMYYRPGTGTIAILKSLEGTFVPVYESSGIGGYDLKSASDRAIAFDYEHSGRLDHLLLYRPGTGIAWVLENKGGTFIPVYQGHGIAGYDLMSADDLAFSFDYDHSGKLDHIGFYRPGTGSVRIAYFP
jgi:DNA-binding winged helix-turn-helix (wHTH) protein